MLKARTKLPAVINWDSSWEEERGIQYEIIPGVTAVSASAAWLGKELTLSGVSQTIILTRFSIKTPFPEREQLPALAKSRATRGTNLVFIGKDIEKFTVEAELKAAVLA